MTSPELLRECDSEPIHVPGMVQTHGALLALQALPEWHVTQASENAAQLFELPLEQVLGARLSGLLQSVGNAPIKDLVEGLAAGELRWSHVTRKHNGPGQVFDAFAHVRDGVTILELEPTTTLDAPALFGFQGELQRAITAIQGAADLSTLCRLVAEQTRRLTGFDRVMIYRFDADANGEVLAESVGPGVDSYLGQHFPASDIPAQARRMLLENWLRMIPDSGYLPSRLTPAHNPETGRPLDLGLSLLRSPSPIHIEYLKNMGVGASLTVSLIDGGKLWGLIAAHHRTPKHVPHLVRQGCELLGRLMSSLLASKEESDDLENKQRLSVVHKQLLQYMAGADDFVSGLVKHSPNLLDLTAAAGAAAAVYFEGKWTLVGKVPRIDAINDLVRWLSTAYRGVELFSTNELPKLYPPAEAFKDLASGLLAISIPKSDNNYVLWFRPEVVQTIAWAGNPQKSVELRGGAASLHPRKSFALWKEVVRSKSLPWRKSELEAASELRKSIVEIDLERQFHRERVARADTEAEKQRFAFLSEASAALVSRLDLETTLHQFGKLTTRRFCDWCVVHLLQEGRYERALVAHTTTEGQLVADELKSYPAPRFDDASPFGKCMAGAAPLLMTRVSPEWVHSISPTQDYARFLLERLGMETVVAAPLIARGQPIGLIKFVRADRTRRFTKEDAQLVNELAGRMASALDNAQLYRAQQEATQAREHVLSVVSHDLRNPIGAIQLGVGAMRRKLDNAIAEPAKSSFEATLQKIDSSCKRMTALIQDVLNLSKMERGRFIIDKREVTADSLLKEALDMLEPLAVARSIHLQVVNHVGHCVVRCEQERIMQVFSNLVGNAIKFIPEHERVTLELVQREPEVVFAVRDTGEGIAPEDLPHLFNRFWQARRTARQGAGLGLAIVKGIVESHGGRVWVESATGKGTSFYFSLPN